MEALILAPLVWFAMVILESSYWFVIALARWAAILAVGALVALTMSWIGLDIRAALAIAAAAALLFRRLLR